MATNPIELRRQKYFKLSAQIAQLNNVQLGALFADSASSKSSTGWGINHIIVLGQSKVFVKRVPVTNLEYDKESFFEQHIFYDYGEVLRNLSHLIRPPYDSCSQNDKRRMMEKYDIKEGLQSHEVGSILLDNIEQIQADRDLKLDEFYVAIIIKYRSIIALMHNFLADMWVNDRKDTKFPHAKLRLLLKETGFLPDAGT